MLGALWLQMRSPRLRGVMGLALVFLFRIGEPVYNEWSEKRAWHRNTRSEHKRFPQDRVRMANMDRRVTVLLALTGLS